MKRRSFSYSFQGASHIRKESDLDYNGLKFPCQDRCYSGSFTSLDSIKLSTVELFVHNNDCYNSSIYLPVLLKPHSSSFYVSVVADGHGGDAYFKSDKGAEFAIQTAIEMLSESIDKIAINLEKKEYEKVNRALSKSFYKRWLIKIIKDINDANYFSFVEDLNKLKNEDNDAYTCYEKDFVAGRSLVKQYMELVKTNYSEDEDNKVSNDIITEFSKLSLKSMYGCTLAVYFELDSKPLWYGFKVGDADLFAKFSNDFVKPIKDDPKCFLNETTSLCNNDAVNNFLFPELEFLNGKPESVLCSSDGISDSFGNVSYHKKFYNQLVFMFNEEEEGGEQTSLNEIKEALPNLSVQGSGDDISLAGFICYDDSEQAKALRKQQAVKKMIEFLSSFDFESAREVIKPFIDFVGYFGKRLIAFCDYKEALHLYEIEDYDSFLNKANIVMQECDELENTEKSEKLKKMILEWRSKLHYDMATIENKKANNIMSGNISFLDECLNM